LNDMMPEPWNDKVRVS